MIQLTNTLYAVVVPEGAHSFKWEIEQVDSSPFEKRIDIMYLTKNNLWSFVWLNELPELASEFEKEEPFKDFEILGPLSSITEEQAAKLYTPMSGIGPCHNHKSALVIAIQSKGLDTSKPERILLIKKDK
ncbi:MAG TPA: hypothetical protein VD996_02555 [Chitinophagaceae bacterium]|nr:hypothetical protein [Chitinophagaceae bacterium]